MKQNLIQAILTTHVRGFVTQITLFVTFVPSVLSVGEQSLAGFVFVLSLLFSLKSTAVSYIRHALITLFDSSASLQRLQVH